MRKLILAAALLAATTFADAQQLPPGKWWRREEVVRQLNLSAEQQNRLDAVFRDAANELIDLRGAVEKASIGLRSELDSNTLDRAAIRTYANRLNDARGKLFERELMMLVDMRAVLNEAQWNRMRAFLDRMDQRRPGGPPGGGPDGPPPPQGQGPGPRKRPRPQ